MRCTRLSVPNYNSQEIFGASRMREQVTASPSVEITLGYQKPTPLKAGLGDFSIETQYSWQSDGDGWKERRIAQQAWLTAVSESSRHLDDFLAGPFRSLHTIVELPADSALPIHV